MQSLETEDSLPKYHENLWISQFFVSVFFVHLNIYLKEGKLGQKHIEEAWMGWWSSVLSQIFCIGALYPNVCLG